MILNTDRVRLLNTQWRYLVLQVVLLAGVSLLLLPGRPVNASLTPVQDGKVREYSLTRVQAGKKVRTQTLGRKQSPDPLKLVVKISEGGGSYKLNDMDTSSLEDLEQKLTQALAGRPDDKKMVLIHAHKTIAGEEVDKVVRAIKKAGGMPNIVINTVTRVRRSRR